MVIVRGPLLVSFLCEQQDQLTSFLPQPILSNSVHLGMLITILVHEIQFIHSVS